MQSCSLKCGPLRPRRILAPSAFVQQQSHHLSIGPPCSSKHRKRRSGMKRLDEVKILTTRDRQRLLVDRNLMGKQSTEKRVDKLIDMAQGRLTWARNQLFQYWNPDWKASEDVLRPKNQGIVMDARWWAWNLAFALLPAFLVGTYCEFRGQYLMYEFHREQELEQMKRLLGEDYVEQNKDKFISPPPENFIKRTWIAMCELSALLRGLAGFRDSEFGAQISPNENVRPISDPGQSTSQLSEKLRISHEIAHNSSTVAPTSLEQLASRIETLEGVVLQELNQERTARYQIERLKQSGIQNRMEDAIIDSRRRSSVVEEGSQDRREQPMQQQSSSLLTLIAKSGHYIAESVREVIAERSGLIEESKQGENTGQCENSTQGENSKQGQALGLRVLSTRLPPNQHDESNGQSHAHSSAGVVPAGGSVASARTDISNVAEKPTDVSTPKSHRSWWPF